MQKNSIRESEAHDGRLSKEYFAMISIEEYSKVTKIGCRRLREISRIEGFPKVCVGRKTLVLRPDADTWIRKHREEISY